MDSMRAILMVLGVVLHSAEVFNPRQTWVVVSDNPQIIMGYLVDFISTFRMPAFFVVSGYFCFLTMRKYRVKKFFKVRVTRVAVPLVVTALTLNVLQAIFLDQVGLLGPLKEYITDSTFIGHLWFLRNLLVYFLIACLLALLPLFLLRFIIRPIRLVFNKVPMLLIVVLLPMVSVVMTSVLVITNMMYFNFFGLYANYIVIMYMPFFFFGVLLGVGKDSLRDFSTVNPLFSLALLAVAVLLASVVDLSSGSNLAEIGVIYLGKLKEWAAVLIVFYLFYKFFSQQSPLMRLMSDASYTIYLFHHLLVIILAVVLIKYSVPALVSVLLSILVVTAVTFVIHTQVIVKSSVLTFLYNGK